MSKRKPAATLFFAAIVLLLAAFTIYDYWSSEKTQETKEQQSKVVQLRRADLNRIEIVGGNETRSFVKKNDVWEIRQPIQEVADQQAIASYLDTIYAEQIQQTVKEAQGSANLDTKTYGLDKPLYEVNLKAQTASENLKVGSVHAYDGSLYGQINDQKKVVLLGSAWMTILSKPIKEFRDKRLYRGSADQEFLTATVEGHDAQGPVHFELVHDKDTWKLKSGEAAADAIDKVNVDAWLTQIKNLRGAEFASQNADAKPFVADETITLTREKGNPFILKIAQDKKNPALTEASSSDLPGAFTERLALAKDGADAIRLRQDAFYNRHAPFDFDPKNVTKAVFHDGKTGKTTEQPVDPAHPDEMIEHLRVLEAVRYLDLGAVVGRKFPSSLKLLKNDGTVVFELAWGDPITEKATADRPEAKVLPVRTNRSKQVIGLAEKSVSDLIERAQSGPAAKKKDN